MSIMEDYTTSSLLLLSIIFTIFFLKSAFKKSKLPPGPKPWPIIGNIHKLGDKPHQAVHKPNLSDLFPLLKMFDLQGAFERTKGYLKKLLGIFGEIIDKRLKDPKDVKDDDVLGTLLKDQELSVDDIKHMLVDLFIAGTDTTSNLLEWAMAELLRNPEKMKKAQIELDQVLGKDGSMQESEIIKLPYIEAIVKEAMRLHPAGPFLIPRNADKEVLLNGYVIPKNSIIWVNIWSIGRDPSVWPDPSVFSPERFLANNIDIKGRNFELIPFGSGRRMCPAVPLANRMVHLMLATLIQSFNWKYIDGANSKAIDMEEKFGLTLQKVNPLKVIPLPK